jgi:hypothetical protein
MIVGLRPRPEKEINENKITNILIIQRQNIFFNFPPSGSRYRTYNLRLKWQVFYHCATATGQR